MNIIYSKNYNFNLGLLSALHPFEGTKFKTVFEALKSNKNVNFIEPSAPADMEIIDEFLSSIMRHRIRSKNSILKALEVPKIPLISFSFLDKRVLSPMRWGVAGTLLGAEKALSEGGIYWNLSGGYHHAMQQNMEGFCIYNDIGICHMQLLETGLLTPEDKILIIDTDAHHGNGNAYTFMENQQVKLLDVYNAGIYPTSNFTRDRIDIPVPLRPGTDGQTYLKKYSEALSKLDDTYRLAFVVAGTDTLATDKLGGLCLNIDDIAEREKITLQTLDQLNIPTVIVGGGGYSKDSGKSIIKAISKCIGMAE
ncbi:histone deacetylase [Hellea sp.]|nr:histone deacetylase [Hellea sp.]